MVGKLRSGATEAAEPEPGGRALPQDFTAEPVQLGRAATGALV